MATQVFVRKNPVKHLFYLFLYNIGKLLIFNIHAPLHLKVFNGSSFKNTPNTYLMVNGRSEKPVREFECLSHGDIIKIRCCRNSQNF